MEFVCLAFLLLLIACSALLIRLCGALEERG